jgi:predicted house-cleaning noncanonical NTP pyrophosphatase (MazG superfamily)
MPTFKLSKLVRDKIIDDQIANGEKPKYRKLDRGEHITALIDKIIEETKELKSTDQTEVIGEIADIQQAIDDLIEIYGITKDELVEIQVTKAEKKGTFAKGLYIDTLEVPENSKWTTYYRKDPKRFPEN